jgi:hypothetical protein
MPAVGRRGGRGEGRPPDFATTDSRIDGSSTAAQRSWGTDGKF